MITDTIYTVGEATTRNVYAAVQTGDLLGLPVYKDEYSHDHLLSGRYIYQYGGWEYVGRPPKRPRPTHPDNTDIPPVCSPDCRWRRTYRDYDRQRNALRMETAHMVQAARCGWNIKPGHLGGRDLDYEPCICSEVEA